MNNIFPTPIELVEQAETPKPANYEEYVAIGIEARQTKDISQWKLGQLAFELTDGYSHKDMYGKKILQDYARDIGCHKKTLERYRRVYKTYFQDLDPKLTKDLHLSFTHYERASRTNDPAKWVLEANDNNWSIEQLDYSIKKHQEEHDEEPEPDPTDKDESWVICPQCYHRFGLDLIDIME